MSADTARTRAEMPAGTASILDRRSLSDSHRRLADLLRPGVRVLDAGCGTGAITSDVADVVGAGGLAVGCDINATLLAEAGARRRMRRQLQFARADILQLPFGPVFDIVTAARVLQWLTAPGTAVAALAGAVKSGGLLLLLDYNHEAIEWVPQPPASMTRFYSAFLAWRANAGFDNRMARRLPSLMASVGATSIELVPQAEHTSRGDADFVKRAGIWADVAATRGRQMVGDGFLSEAERRAAEHDYRDWLAASAESMTLHLEAIQGVIRA